MVRETTQLTLVAWRAKARAVRRCIMVGGIVLVAKYT